MNSHLSSNQNRAMTEDQFTQVVEAILDGKYSWACVLILRFAGYNPLHYIPYRTYNRLIKDNHCRSSVSSSSAAKNVVQPLSSCAEPLPHSLTTPIQDLNYLEPLDYREPTQTSLQGRSGFAHATYLAWLQNCFSGVCKPSDCASKHSVKFELTQLFRRDFDFSNNLKLSAKLASQTNLKNLL